MSHFKNWPTTKTKVLTGISASHCNESGGLKKKKKTVKDSGELLCTFTFAY